MLIYSLRAGCFVHNKILLYRLSNRVKSAHVCRRTAALSDKNDTSFDFFYVERYPDNLTCEDNKKV